jgi:CRP-like cAMP-binding protein
MANSDDDNRATDFEESAGETTEMEAHQSEAAELFRSSELFEGLTPEEVREIIHVSERRSLEADEWLFEQGDDAEALFVVDEGDLEVISRTEVGEEVVLAQLGSEAVVGEMSIIGGGTRSASVVARSETELFRLSREAFQSLRDQDRPAAYKIIVRLAKTLGDRRRRTDARIQEVFDDPAEHLEQFEEQVHEMLGQIRKA